MTGLNFECVFESLVLISVASFLTQQTQGRKNTTTTVFLLINFHGFGPFWLDFSLGNR